MSRRAVNPDALHSTDGYSHEHAVVADGTLYMSGQVGLDSDGEIVGDDITSQARQAFENIGGILAAEGRDFDDVVKVTAYIVDPHDRFEDYHAVYDEYFDGPYPAHTVLGVEQLAGPEYIIEIEADVPVEQ